MLSRVTEVLACVTEVPRCLAMLTIILAWLEAGKNRRLMNRTV